MLDNDSTIPNQPQHTELQARICQLEAERNRLKSGLLMIWLHLARRKVDTPETTELIRAVYLGQVCHG